MDPQKISALRKLGKIKEVRKTQVHCHVAQQRAMVSSLMTKDDLALRTAVISPDLYELELSKIIYKYTEFPDVEEPIAFPEFLKGISFPDRQMLTWGLFAATYRTLGKQTIACNNTLSDGNTCPYVHEEEILAEDLINPDMFAPWDNEAPFFEYVYPVEEVFDIEGLYKISLDLCVPSIQDHINVIKLIPADKIKDNFNRLGLMLSRSEALSTVTKNIKMYASPEDKEPEIFKTPVEIHYAIDQELPLDLTSKFMNKHNEMFGKYFPTFKKTFMCPECQNEFDFVTNIEASLFYQFFRS
jgi:hypothetical protein